MLLFRDEEHVNRWCRAREIDLGYMMSPEQGWGLARAWYRDKIKPEWRRHTLEETEALLAALELTGPFWDFR